MKKLPKTTQLPDLIVQVSGEDKPIEDLSSSEKYRLLEMISSNSLPLHIYGKRGFDILANSFFAMETVPNPAIPVSVKEVKRVFDSFDEFWGAVDGDVYTDSCFFGYTFSKREIEDYSLDLKRINTDAFIDFDVSRDDYETVIGEKNRENEERIGKVLRERAKKFRSIKSYKDFLKRYNSFTKISEDTPINFSPAAYRAFFTTVKKHCGDQFESFCVSLFCEKGPWCGLSFEEIYFDFSREQSTRVFSDYAEDCSQRTKRERLKTFQAVIDDFGNEKTVCRTKGKYDENSGTYWVTKLFRNPSSPLPTKVEKVFLDFADFASYLGGDLRRCDLRFAPIDSASLIQYCTDESTKFPLSRKCVNHQVAKIYKNGKFHVKHRWINDEKEILGEWSIEFAYFCDFAHYLRYDLSRADLLECDGLEKLKGFSFFNWQDAKMRSLAGRALGCVGTPLSLTFQKPADFEVATKNEEESRRSLEILHPVDGDDGYSISYISDIHLEHRIDEWSCETEEDVEYVLRTLADELMNGASDCVLICGDVAHDLGLYERFLMLLEKRKRPLQKIFFTLGNHEFWPFASVNTDVKTIAETYRSIIEKHGMYLLQNDLYYESYETYRLERISQDDLNSFSPEELHEKTRSAPLVLFGGVGFAGKNEEFNASDYLYLTALNRQQEINESRVFASLHSKVCQALQGRNLVVATHMPMVDWDGKRSRSNGVVYVHGHDHRNYFFDDGSKRIYGDNQVGYHGKHLRLKTLTNDFGFDWFVDRSDGIYEITSHDYSMFNRGINVFAAFERPYKNLYVIKRESFYMFLFRDEKDRLYYLNGGVARKTNGHDLQYYYEHMAIYARSIKEFLSSYSLYQKDIAREIKKIGGEGAIHGCIVDIDFLNHLFINPFDGTVTPYFAYSIQEKYVYDNLLSLLKNQKPDLLANYKRLVNEREEGGGNRLPALFKGNEIVDESTFVAETDIYKVSRLLRGFQYTIKNNLIRTWNDELASGVSKENGKLILINLLGMNSAPTNED